MSSIGAFRIGHSLDVQIPEVRGWCTLKTLLYRDQWDNPQYGKFVWPSAVYLAHILVEHKVCMEGQVVLEVSSHYLLFGMNISSYRVAGMWNRFSRNCGVLSRKRCLLDRRIICEVRACKCFGSH